jgi:hypothetical protein
VNGEPFFAALATDDEERRAADEHAARCGSCRDALQEDRLLLALIKRAMPLPRDTGGTGNVV